MANNEINKNRSPRVGIYSGTFDPVHAGHIAFALQAVEAAKLDNVYFMPERQPRHKAQVTHYAHRVAMLRRAVRPHAQLAVLESEDKAFSIVRTLPRLRTKFGHATLVYICGSDVLAHIGTWPHSAKLLNDMELCVGLRRGEVLSDAQKLLAKLPVQPRSVVIIKSHAPLVSSSTIRIAIHNHSHAQGLLYSVLAYAKQEWLYV